MNATLKKINLKNGKKLFKKLKEPGDSLTEKTIKGGLWVFGLRVTDKIFGLIRTIILARLLSPNDFGVFGVALLALSALDTFSQTGFKQALIQKKEETKYYLDTAWTVGVIRGFFIAIILFFIAPLAADFFETPTAEPILKVIGISIVLQGLTNIAVLYFEKELEFHKYFKYQFLGTVTDMIVSVTAAFLLNNVWALVFGLLAGNLVRCVMSYVVDKYRPKFEFDRNQAKELFGFGKWILGSSVLVFLSTQGDDIFVGKFLGTTMLGFYQMAYKISNLPSTEIAAVVSQVTFPTYSKLQDNTFRLREAYLKILQIITFLSFFITSLIFALSSDFTKLFLGEKWMLIVPMIQLLVIEGLVRSVAATAGPIFEAVGNPKMDTKWQIVRVSILTIFIYPLALKWGILGIVITVVLSILIPGIGLFFEVAKIIKCSFKKIFNTIIYPFMDGILTIILIFLLKKLLGSGLWEFILLSLVGILMYFIIAFLFDKFFNYKIGMLIKETVQLSFKRNN